MHVHLPKPLHGWREFAGEVGIIVIGVLIALIGEAMFDDWNWDRKMDAARAAMNHEIKSAILDTVEADRMKACGDTQLDFLQAKIVAKDWNGISQASAQLSFYARRFYGEDAYTSAVASQVAEHLTQDELQRYAGVYTQIRKIRQHQEDGWTTDAVFSLANIPNLPRTDAIQLEELNAIAKLRDSINAIRGQGSLLRADAQKDLGITADASDLAKTKAWQQVMSCETAATAVRKLETS